MKLGVSYNLFDGHHLLEMSVKTIKPCVDYINVIAQNVSNHGNRLPEHLEKEGKRILERLWVEGYIDEVVYLEPSIQREPTQVWIHELQKRQKGYDLCKDNGCTHYMSMDADEFYKPEELEYAKQIIEENDYDGAICRARDYWGGMNRQRLGWGTNVPIMYKIDGDRKFIHCSLEGRWKAKCDPTRQIPCENLHILDHEKICMHHMSNVRRSLEEIEIKMNNSSANCNYSEYKLNRRFEAFKEYQISGKTQYETNEVDNSYWIIGAEKWNSRNTTQ